MFGQYYNNLITTEEKIELAAIVKTANDEELSLVMNQTWNSENGERLFFNPDTSKRMLNNIQSIEKREVPVRRMFWVKMVAAAAILVILATGGYFMLFKSEKRPVEIAKQPTPSTDIQAPAVVKATITLADGRRVALDSITNGTLVMQNGVQVTKNEKGEIVYSGKTGEVAYNLLQNPRGSLVVNLTLSDGTKVWLNSESALRYPTVFTGSSRQVEITGEAYFEVAHDAAKPFYVTKGEMQIKVLGTHFNVNAYDDEEAVKVTLLKGSVAVNRQSSMVKLKPGEQAVVKQDAPISIHYSPDIDAVMAWKNGRFSFENADLKTVMRQVARWYDVEVDYAGKVPEGKFRGKISKDLSLSQLLNGLTSTRIRFTLENNKQLTILPD